MSVAALAAGVATLYPCGTDCRQPARERPAT